MRIMLKALLVAASALSASAAAVVAREASVWSRDGKASLSTVAPGCFEVRYDGREDWSVKGLGEFAVLPGEVFRFSCESAIVPGMEATGHFEISAVVYDDSGKVIDWRWGSAEGKIGATLVTEFAIPAKAAKILPRIAGYGAIAGRFSKWTMTRGRQSVLGKTVAHTESFKSGPLKVTVTGREGALSVTDARTGRTWAPTVGARGYAVTSLEKVGAESVRLHLVEPEGLTAFTAVVLADSKRPGELIIALEGEGAMRHLPWPEAFATKNGDRLVLPLGEGMGFPVEEHHPLLEGAYPTYAGNSLSMAFFGVVEDATGSGYFAMVETPDDAAVAVARVDGTWLAGVEWRAQKGEFGYRRRLRLVFQDRGGHVAMCKRYREYVKAKGLLKTFAEKVKERPQVDRLLGAVNVWSWEWGSESAMALFNEMRASGIRRMLWSSAGSAVNVATMAKIPEILVGRYDNYSDVWSPEQIRKLGWNRENESNGYCADAWPEEVIWDGPTSNDWRRSWAVKAKDGTWVHAATLCDAAAPKYLREVVRRELGEKPYNARFLDTSLAAPWRECYCPKHPLTRTESRLSRMDLFKVLTDEFKLVVGSESGHEAGVRWCDYFEGMLSIDHYRVPEAGRNLQQVWNEAPEIVVKYQLGERYRLPLWELVYHDCACAHWYWGDYNNKLPQLWRKRDLFNALYGTMGMFLLTRKQWDVDKEKFVRSYETTSPIARATGYSEMLDHRVLSSDRAVQQTRFADGTVVTVNFRTLQVKVDP